MSRLERILKRQSVLADFGEFALRSDNLQEILDEACRLVGRALGTDFAKVVEVQHDSDSALIRAGVGWREGVVGKVTLPLGERSSETYAIKQRKPLIMQDIAAEERFDIPLFMKEHGVVSIANVPIFLPGGAAYGLLQVDSTRPHNFDEGDIEFLRVYAIILGPVIDRLHKAHDLRVALKQNQRMMRELQHRIKNNIGVISGLVRMRARAARTEEARQDLAAIGERIETLRLVHEQLYVSSSPNKLELRCYVSSLLDGLCDLHEHDLEHVEVHAEICEVEVLAEQAVPIGLIINEFVTNSVKYAFDGGTGRIDVFIRPGEDGKLVVELADTGKGLPVPDQVPSGTGLRIIDSLIEQVGGVPRWSLNDGTRLSFEFAS